MVSILTKVFIGYFLFNTLKNFGLIPVFDRSSRKVNCSVKANDTVIIKLFSSPNIKFDIKQANFLDENTFNFGSFNEKEFKSIDLVIEPENNEKKTASCYLHVFLLDSNNLTLVYQRKNLLIEKKKNLEFNLISGEKDKQEQDLLWFYPEISVSLISNNLEMDFDSITPLVKSRMNFISELKFSPILFLNDFWEISDKFIPFDKQIKLKVYFEPISLLKFQLYLQFQGGFKQGSMSDKDVDDIKRLFSDTNPVLLFITILVSVLHSLFDFLAFKNDITFWKDRKDLQGLSVRSLLVNAISQTIIFFYLIDKKTSWLVSVSMGIGVLIEFWKISKASKVSFSQSWPFIHLQDSSSYIKNTKEHDDKAMKYLFYASIPLLLGYSIYSLIFLKFTSWYSYMLETLVGFVYAFGFILMTPQLFINYKLKSVAHMPWKSFMYKALNTFVDDLFAFVIKMPLLHRIACFRDDFLFIIYLYQRWIYPVDKTRVNEFGQSGDQQGKEDYKESVTENKTRDSIHKDNKTIKQPSKLLVKQKNE